MNPTNQPNQQPTNPSDLEQALDPNPYHLSENDPNIAKDPVCGMLVDKRTAKNTLPPSMNTNMQTLYFCSADCKATFEQDPERFGFKHL